MNKKEFVSRHRGLISFACRCHNLGSLLRLRIKGQGNRVEIPCALLKKTRIRILGDNNSLKIGDFSQLQGVSIEIHGSNNRIELGNWGTFNGTGIYVEQNNNVVCVGNHAHFYGNAELAAMEGTRLTVGEDCLCSSNIQIRTGDSHAVLDMSGCRTNPSRDVTLGNHVWLGRDVTILKGSSIGSHCLVGTRALVTGDLSEPNCALGGIPARVLKKQVDWSVHHIAPGTKAPDFMPPDTWEDRT